MHHDLTRSPPTRSFADSPRPAPKVICSPLPRPAGRDAAYAKVRFWSSSLVTPGWIADIALQGFNAGSLQVFHELFMRTKHIALIAFALLVWQKPSTTAPPSASRAELDDETGTSGTLVDMLESDGEARDGMRARGGARCTGNVQDETEE
ncbi:unnamed protein product [Cutaneotrichosporon oleaginosum]